MVGGSRPLGATSSDNTGAVRTLSEKSFGKYTLIAKIGHGGMAEVFLAASRGPAGFTKLCVVKRLHPHLEDEESLTGMFLDEARLAARLNHPNVVQTYEVGEADGYHFLAMEYLEGQSLARVMRHLRRLDQPLPLAVGVRMFIEVLDGLEHAHTLRDFDGTPLHVVHRDISPGNIFATYDGQLKLLDFGIARAGTQMVETRAGQVKGKFAYIAPEQASPDGNHDQRADLWSLGVVMWEAFAGKRLFKGESEVVTLHNALTSQILSLDHELPDIPEELARIVDRALQRDPDARYRSAREMKEDLEAFMIHEGLRASRQDVGAFVTGLFQRERDEQRQVLGAYMRGETQGVDLGPMMTTTGTGSGFSPVSAVGQTTTGPRRRPLLLVALVMLLAAGVGAFFALRDTDPERLADGEPTALAPSGSDPPERDEEPVAPQAEATAQEPPVETTPSPEVTTAEVTTAEVTTAEVTMAEVAPSPMDEAPREPTVMATRPGMRPVSRTTSTAAAVMREPIADPVPPPRMEEAPAGMVEEGFLTLDTVPWSNVQLGNRRLGTTPLIRLRLPVGEHVLTLSNPEQGVRSTYRVTIRAGETTARRIALQ
ncbi:MAG: protein kinase [Myxococcales bacterium]|nr:protein kinase [Myxococcales bacterium]